MTLLGIELLEGKYQGVAIRSLPGSKVVEVLEPIRLPTGEIIPPGFICDLDSVPRLAGLFYAWLKGRTTLGAIVHDYCYRNRLGREYSDLLFSRVMKWEGVRNRYRRPIYAAVRVFGGAHY